MLFIVFVNSRSKVSSEKKKALIKEQDEFIIEDLRNVLDLSNSKKKNSVRDKTINNEDGADINSTTDELYARITGGTEIEKMNRVELVMLLKSLVTVPSHKLTAIMGNIKYELDKLKLPKVIHRRKNKEHKVSQYYT